MLRLIYGLKRGVVLTAGKTVLVRGELLDDAVSSAVESALIKAVADLGCEVVGQECTNRRNLAQAQAMLGFADKLLARMSPPMGKAARVKLLKGAYAGFGEKLARRAVKP